MPIADFIHLKVRSAYSLTEGANKVDKVVALAKENAMPAVAVTDRNNLFGALEFSQYAAKAGIQPIIGCDLAIRREEEGGIATAGKLPPVDWLTLLVQSEQGYLNLMRLVSRAHLEFKAGSTAALPLDELVGHTEGLLAFTGSAGSALGRLLGGGQGPAAQHQLDASHKLFAGRLYLELQRHGEDNERRIEGPLIDLAYAKGLPLVATNDVYFPKAAMYEAHDVLLCIEQGAHIEDPNRRRLTPEHYFKSAARDARALRRPARGLRQHPGRSPSAAPTCPSRASRSCRATPSSTAAPKARRCAHLARDRPRGAARRSAGWPPTSTSRRTRNGSTTNST